MTRPPQSLFTHCLTHFEVCHTHFEIQRLASLSYGEEPANKTTQNQPKDSCKPADFSPARELIKKHRLYWAIAYHAVPTPFHRLHARDSAVTTNPFHTIKYATRKVLETKKNTPFHTQYYNNSFHISEATFRPAQLRVQICVPLVPHLNLQGHEFEMKCLVPSW